MKILAIGNSFSANATRFLGDITNSARDCQLTFAHACIGGCPLEKHYNLALRHEDNPSDAEGMPYTLGQERMGLKEMLSAERWHYVTIQQYSMHSFRIDSYRPFAKLLCDYVHTYAPQAEIVFHQTWAYRSDDKDTFVSGYTQEKMYQDLAAAYQTIAREIGIKRIIPVGDAFQLVTETSEWRFIPDKEFNYSAPNYPDVPKEVHSLHAGYGWRGEGTEKTFFVDTHHANSAGEYLGGCVWFEFFFGRDARTVRFKPSQLSGEDAGFLKEIAHDVVTNGVRPATWSTFAEIP